MRREAVAPLPRGYRLVRKLSASRARESGRRPDAVEAQRQAMVTAFFDGTAPARIAARHGVTTERVERLLSELQLLRIAPGGRRERAENVIAEWKLLAERADQARRLKAAGLYPPDRRWNAAGGTAAVR